MSHASVHAKKIGVPGDLSIRSLLQTRARQIPDAVAIAAPGRASLTYANLWRHIETAVSALRAMGIGRHDRVVIMLPQGPEMATAFVAVAAGATSAPLNPAYRAAELDFYLSDLNAKALILESGTDSPARAIARARGVPIIELAPVREAEAGVFTLTGAEHPEPVDDGFAEPGDTALVLHTSGTTSRPKSVPLTHTNLCASAQNIAATLALTETDRCLSAMPLFHIHGLIGGLLSSLAAGAGFVSTPAFDPGCFFDWMKEFQPTWYTAVPTIHQAILRCARERGEPIETGRLRFIRSSSAPLPVTVMAQLEEVFKAPVIEAYGMTEASHQITSNPLPPSQRKAGSVGVATGTDVAIMDEAGNVLAAQKRGEIVIRGMCVMGGYAGNVRANRESFTNGWFRTGDQGYFDGDGYLFITGRLKEIINRGGEKILPAEVDRTLSAHPAVAEAIAFAVPHPTLGEDVAAAVVLEKNAVAAEEDIREFMVARLADFKVPHRILIVDRIPRAGTGKIQRRGLAESFSRELRKSDGAPMSALEQAVAEIYAEVLSVQSVGRSDHFFALGGDSLRATQVLSRVRAKLHVNLTIATIFKKATVAELAEEIARTGPAAETREHSKERDIEKDRDA